MKGNFLLKAAMVSGMFSLAGCNGSSFYPKSTLSAMEGGDDSDVYLDGGSTGGFDGPGSASGGSSSGGSSSGSSSGGSSDGGVTDGGSTSASTGASSGGATSGGTSGGSAVTEAFVQNAAEQRKVDILWVVDNSGSMADEQADLAYNFDTFIGRFLDVGADFKMAITTTDTRVGYHGVAVPGSMDKLTAAKAAANEAQFISDFQSLIKVGINGSGNERGLSGARKFFEVNSSFLREDAYLAIVILSDEEDQSGDTVPFYVSELIAHKTNTAKVQIHSIVNLAANQSGVGVTLGGERYRQASIATNGRVAEIQDDFYPTLDALSEKIVNLLDSFALVKTPDVSTIKVYVDGVESQDWSYDADNNAIKFDAGSIPDEGSAISVEFIEA